MVSRAKRARWTAWVLALLLMALAGGLCVQCVAIYRAGNAPENLSPAGVRLRDVYSRAIVAQYAAPLALPALAALVMTVVALVASRGVKPAALSPLDPAMQLKLLKRHRDMTPEMRQEEQRRGNIRLGCAVVGVLCAAPALMYLLNRSHFISWDLELVMGAMVLHVAPWLGAVLVVLLVGAELEHRSLCREVALAQKAPRRLAAAYAPARGHTRAVRIALYGVAVALVVAGILNGGMYDVLVKAINICTECIGLG